MTPSELRAKFAVKLPTKPDPTVIPFEDDEEWPGSCCGIPAAGGTVAVGEVASDAANKDIIYEEGDDDTQAINDLDEALYLLQDMLFTMQEIKVQTKRGVHRIVSVPENMDALMQTVYEFLDMWDMADDEIPDP